MKKIHFAVLVLLAVGLAGYAGQDYTFLKVKVQTANVRAKADSTGAVIKQVKLDDLLLSRVKIGDWYEVGVLNDSGHLAVGYIGASMVDFIVAKTNQPTAQENYRTAEKEIHDIAIALMDYLTDGNHLPAQKKPSDWQLGKESSIYGLLVPQYSKSLPLLDPWQRPYRIYFGNNVFGKHYFEDYGIQEFIDDDFLIFSTGIYGPPEDWRYDSKNPEAGLYSEFDKTKNLICFNGTMIRGMTIQTPSSTQAPAQTQKASSRDMLKDSSKTTLDNFSKERRSEQSSSPINRGIQLKPIKSERLSPSDSPQTVTGEGQIKVTVPGGLLKTPATLTISAVSNPPQSPGPDIKTLAAYDVSLGDVHQLPLEMEIELPVPAEALRTDCPPEAALCAGYFDAAAQGWVELPVTLSTDRKSMMIRTQHLSLLAWWYIGLDYTYWPGRDFAVFYHKDAVAKTTADYEPKYPSTDPAIPGYVSDIYKFAEQARDAYEKYELRPYNQPLWIVVMPNNSNPEYTWHLQRLFMSCGSTKPDILHYAVSHEMFHAIQHAAYLRWQAIRSGHRWWLEATAEYASSRVAMKQYGKMGKIDEQVMPPQMLLVQLPFFGEKKDDSKITGARYHQYQMAHFLEFICKQLRPDDPPGFFVDMYKDVVRRTVEGEGWIERAPSAADSLNAFLIARMKDTSLDDMFRKFAVFYLLSPDSPMNMKDAPPGQVNPTAVRGTYMLKAAQKAIAISKIMSGEHSAEMMLVQAEMSGGKASREIAVELADQELPPRTALFVYKLPGKERARMETAGAFTKPEQAKDSIPVTLGADDQIALVAINDYTGVQTVRAVVKSGTTSTPKPLWADIIIWAVGKANLAWATGQNDESTWEISVASDDVPVQWAGDRFTINGAMKKAGAADYSFTITGTLSKDGSTITGASASTKGSFVGREDDEVSDRVLNVVGNQTCSFSDVELTISYSREGLRAFFGDVPPGSIKATHESSREVTNKREKDKRLPQFCWTKTLSTIKSGTLQIKLKEKLSKSE